jgi:hypothetical protein
VKSDLWADQGGEVLLLKISSGKIATYIGVDSSSQISSDLSFTNITGV